MKKEALHIALMMGLMVGILAFSRMTSCHPQEGNEPPFPRLSIYKAMNDILNEGGGAQPVLLSAREGKISRYDSLFRKHAPQCGWDWRLLAALSYSESNFDTAAISPTGAMGLMQLMPPIARHMGVMLGKELDPDENIRAGVELIRRIETYFTSVPPEEKLLFVLAAYNSGIGHIFDAMALAEKYGADKYRWEGNVSKYLDLKSDPGYYTDTVCRYGPYQGVMTNLFVQQTLNRYNLYQRIIRKNP